MRWLQLAERLRAYGARRFVEIGPGHVLTGLVRHSPYGVEAHTVEELEGVHA